jgi:hypothetical protein
VIPKGRASPTSRDPACYLTSLLKIVYIYMRRGPALLGEISLFCAQDLEHPVGLEISHINTTRGAGPPTVGS